jgi:HPt (histidine-containing phosphotransfer) domain-containing protein
LPIDFNGALHRFGDDRVFMMEMCKEFAAGLQDRLKEINLALAENDANKLGRLGHNLKGVSLNFNAEPLAEIAKKLEELGKREDLTEAPGLVRELEIAVHSFEEFLANQTL